MNKKFKKCENDINKKEEYLLEMIEKLQKSVYIKEEKTINMFKMNKKSLCAIYCFRKFRTKNQRTFTSTTETSRRLHKSKRDVSTQPIVFIMPSGPFYFSLIADLKCRKKLFCTTFHSEFMYVTE